MGFQQKKTHLALVCKRNDIVGIVTLEDIFEELIQEEIMDETDESQKQKVQVADMFRRITTTIKKKPGLLSPSTRRSAHRRTVSTIDEGSHLLGKSSLTR